MKLCTICNRLYKNMSDHLIHGHKIGKNHPEYSRFVKAPVIPDCFVKIVGGKTVCLQPEELEEAAVKNPQYMCEAQLIKRLLYTEGGATETESEEEQSCSQELQLDGGEGKMGLWRKAFEEHLSDKGNTNSKVEASLAFRVLLSHYNKSEDITLDEILDPFLTNKILKFFKNLPNMNSTTKHKYVTFYKTFVHFLAVNVCSPEHVRNETPQQFEVKNFKLNQVMHEIDTMRAHLSKHRGIDIMACRERSKEKVLSQVELYNVSESENAETYAEMTEEAFEKFTLSECIDMRDTLIAVSVLKLSNRSKELTTMTLTEARKPVNKTKEGEPYKIISVRDHKRSSSGKPAPVALTETAYSVLLKYIQFVRPRLASEGSELVFTTSTSSPANPTGRLSYPAINRILAKAENSIQRPTGSRIFRCSRITNSRKNRISAPEAEDMATSTSHTPAVSNIRLEPCA